MASNVDPAIPPFGAATTAGVRANFLTIKEEIEALQNKKDPFGFIYFENIATPYTVTYPSVYTKINPVTVTPGLSFEVTEGANARLTYQGANRVMDIQANLSLDQSSGSDKDIQVSIHKNGAILAGATAILTCASGSKRFISIYGASSLTVGDYLEVFMKNNGASGDVRVFTFMLALDPH